MDIETKENNKSGKVDKEAKIIEKKKHIVESLKNCLEKTVYSQISLEDVAQEAGLSKGGLRHYFPTREELYTDLIDSFFNQIEKDHISVMQGLDLDNNDKALVTTLFGVEKFLLDKKNIKILINIFLYGFEDEKMMDIIKKYIRNHLRLYENIIKSLKVNSEVKQKETEFRARITQIILLCAGLFESIDPINMETTNLIEFILQLYKSSES